MINPQRHKILTSYGFKLNYKPRKSAFTLHIAGNLTETVKQRLLTTDAPYAYAPVWDLKVPITS